MPQLLLELFSEDIPARMQGGAARDLARLAGERLAQAGLPHQAVRTFGGLRRLTLVVDGLPAQQPDVREERKGPRVGAPAAALEGFLRSTGLAQDQLEERDGAWFASLLRPGRPAAEIIAEMVPAVVRAFPWPKSMTSATGELRWVRPLRRILCVFDRVIVPFEIDGVAAGDLSEGHRFMGPRAPFRARDFDEYREALAGHFVVLDPSERRRRIVGAARELCEARGLELVGDDGLLEEVAGMVEWPAPLVGDMDQLYLDLPPEVVRTSMRTHQRYFAVRLPDGPLAPHFISVANVEAPDGGSLIAAGNARVLSARLEDARFFWNEDRKIPLEDRLQALKGVIFHARIGTMYDRVDRLRALAARIAPMIGADPDRVLKAAALAKADLTTGMVGEFPELQGIMGGYYAAAEGQDAQVAAAIRDHYRPQGPSDAVPGDRITIAVALADKLDTLISFFAIDEKPTGSRDPYALRRAALGVIRITLDNGLRLPLRRLAASGEGLGETGKEADALLEFFADRLKVLLRDLGRRHDLVDAIFALGDDDLTRVVARIDALTVFLTTADGANLLAGYKRATNILTAEAKKGTLSDESPVRAADGLHEEIALFDALARVRPMVAAALADEDFVAAMSALASLRAPVDAFFDKVFVNSPDPAQRENRLRLLCEVRNAMGAVADFSRISG
jgi:glycyl-tRNA synthetase beta chain